MLLFAILYVVARGKRSDGSAESKTPRPTHSLLTDKITSRFNLDYRPYEASTGTSKVSLYGQQQLQRHPSLTADPNSSGSCPHTQETIYEEPSAMKLYSSSGFLSLNRKFSSDPVLSEDGDGADDDYAEPVVNLTASNSFSENICTPAVTVGTSPAKRALKPLPLSHYARPMTPPSPTSAATAAAALVGSPLLTRRRMSQQSAISAKISPPRYTTLAPVLPPPPPPQRAPAPPPSLRASLLDSNANSHQLLASPLLPSASNGAENRDTAFLPLRGFLVAPSSPASSLASSSVFPVPSSSRLDTTTEDDDDGVRTQDDDLEDETRFPFYYASADVCVPDAQDLASLYRKIDETWQHQQAQLRHQQQQQQQQQKQQLQQQQQKQQRPTIGNSGSLERIVGLARLVEIPRERLVPMEKLGEGQFGEIHVCRLSEEARSEGDSEDEVDNRKEEGIVVAVKSLREGCNQAAR